MILYKLPVVDPQGGIGTITCESMEELEAIHWLSKHSIFSTWDIAELWFKLKEINKPTTVEFLLKAVAYVCYSTTMYGLSLKQLQDIIEKEDEPTTRYLR